MARLGDVCIIESGGTPSRSNTEYWNNGSIPWVKISDIVAKKVVATEERITESGLQHSSAKLFSKGTILYTIFATLGEVGILDIDAATNQAIAGLKIIDDAHVDRNYLYYFLISLHDFVNATGRGVAQSNINLTILRSIEIPLPDLPTQRRIAATLDKVSEGIDLCRKMLADLDVLVKAQFVEMFGDPIVNDKHLPTMQGNLFFKLSNGKFVPEAKRFESGVPVYGGNGISWYTDEILVDTDTLVVGRVGFQSGNVHYAEGPLWVSDNAMYISNYNERAFDLLFLCHLMEHIDFTCYQDAGDLKKITQKPFMAMEYIHPSLQQQQKYTAIVKQVDKSRFAVQQQLAELETLKKSLMQEYFG